MKSFRNKFLLVVGLFVLSIALFGCSSTETESEKASESSSAPAETNGEVQVVNATTSNWKIELEPAEVKAGVPVKFIVNSKEGIHGFQIVGTEVNPTVLPGTPVEVEYTFAEAGEYTIQCSVPCGSGHSDMKTTLTVK